MNLPGYDAWKLDNPDDLTAAEEAKAIREYNEAQDDLREQIAATLADWRRHIYLADIRRVVVMVFLFATHALGDAACDALQRRGIHLRPRNRPGDRT